MDLLLHLETPAGPRDLLIPHDQTRMALTEILRRHGLPLNTRCGERSHCDGCIVDLAAGTLEHVHSGKLVKGNGESVPVRACEYRLNGGGGWSVRIPPRSALAYQPEVLTDYAIAVPYAHHPIWQELRVASSVGTVADLARHLSTTALAGRPVEVSAEAAAGLARHAVDQPVYVTLEYRGQHWLATGISAQPVARPALGAAVDIGTTTVVLLLVDLATGQVLSRAASFNQQINLGDNVVTRITLCTQNPSMVKELQQAVADHTLAALLQEALAKAGLAGRAIKTFSVAGNTTMQHLAAGVDPSSMGVSPFTAKFLDHKVLETGEVFGQDAVTGTPSVHLLPSAAAYVGADLTAGILASGLLYDEGPSLLVDVGTNGEIIFKHGNKMLGCATAAGPAFEGAGLSAGMRAGEGAIAHLRFEGGVRDLKLEQIGDGKTLPTGCCGSFYVDFLSEARRVGLLNMFGRFEPVEGSEGRIVEVEGGKAFRVADGVGKRPILVTEKDISSLLAAKAAIASGILILLQRAGVKASDIKKLYLAGGFGTHMVAAHAIGCGLLPGFDVHQIVPVGNTSLAGAYLGLMDSSALDEISRIAKRVEIVELNMDPEFENTYIDQLCLPG